MNTPGRYDDICTIAREKAEADMVVLLVAGGNKGQGFSVQSNSQTLVKTLPETLRMMADRIEKDIGEKDE